MEVRNIYLGSGSTQCADYSKVHCINTIRVKGDYRKIMMAEAPYTR